MRHTRHSWLYFLYFAQVCKIDEHIIIYIFELPSMTTPESAIEVSSDSSTDEECSDTEWVNALRDHNRYLTLENETLRGQARRYKNNYNKTLIELGNTKNDSARFFSAYENEKRNNTRLKQLLTEAHENNTILDSKIEMLESLLDDSLTNSNLMTQLIAMDVVQRLNLPSEKIRHITPELCIICIERRRMTVFFPCGHHLMCDTCTRQFVESAMGQPMCPICRMNIACSTHLFTP